MDHPLKIVNHVQVIAIIVPLKLYVLLVLQENENLHLNATVKMVIFRLLTTHLTNANVKFYYKECNRECAKCAYT